MEETEIDVDPSLPIIRVVRDFEAPRDRVFEAWTDPGLVGRWLGPRSTTTRVDEWDARTGGSYRYSSVHDEEVIASFHGSFHEVRSPERLVQTFAWTARPDEVSLETLTFTDLGEGRTRVRGCTLVESIAVRDAMLASGMEVGVIEGFEKLAELLGEYGLE